MVTFFIERPIFAATVAIIMILAGLVCLRLLPVSQFPEMAPPQITMKADVPIFLDYVGTTEAMRTVTLRAKVTGSRLGPGTVVRTSPNDGREAPS